MAFQISVFPEKKNAYVTALCTRVKRRGQCKNYRDISFLNLAEKNLCRGTSEQCTKND